MALLFKKLELSNIRSHESIIFEPAEEGLTSISGPNGSGKSTLVDSIAWLLYGTKPQGVSKSIAILKEGAEIGKDKCFARIEFIVDGRELQVERRMVTKNGATECEVKERLLQKDNTLAWATIAGPAVSHAEPYIKKLLHMNEKGFLAAILIQQKQVDQLISATPRERAAVIEKLTGIAGVTAAVTESRQEYNSLKKMAGYSTINEAELDTLKTEKETLDNTLTTLAKHFNKLSHEENILKKSGSALKIKVTEEAEKFELAADDKSRIQTLLGSIDAKEKELTRIQKEKEEKRKRITNTITPEALQELGGRLEELKKELNSHDEAAYKSKAFILDWSEKSDIYNDLLNKSKIKELAPALKGVATQKNKYEKSVLTIDNLNKKISHCSSNIEVIANAIDVISGSHGKCPTCLQKVSDVAAAVDSLENERKTLLNEVEETEAILIKEEDILDHIKITQEKFEQLIEAINGLDTAQKLLTDENKVLGGHLAQKKTVEGELKGIEKVHAQAKAQEELKDEYDRVLGYAQEVNNEVEALKREKQTLESTDRGALTQTKINKLRKELEDARTSYMTITGKLTEEKGEIKLITERRGNLAKKIVDQELAIEKHKTLLKSVEIAANSTQVLEEFRTNRIESSVPLIEAYASDLLSRFTEGRFTRLKIDGKFNTSVVLADGNERAIGLLSGGELSAASMSLRLAISMLLNGGSTQSIIILDEVLVSQDDDRAELILATIKDVCHGQVILIAHNNSINDVADKIVILD